MDSHLGRLADQREVRKTDQREVRKESHSPGPHSRREGGGG